MTYRKYKIFEFYYKLVGKSEKLLELKINYAKSIGVIIGKDMRCFSNPWTSEPYLLSFGDNTTISGDVIFLTHDNSAIKIFKDFTDTVGKIKIGNNCFIGYGSIILPGVVIGDNTIIAAGSVVTKSFKNGNVIIGGNPAKVICTLDEYKDKIEEKVFNFKNMTFNQKKEMILKNEDIFLKK